MSNKKRKKSTPNERAEQKKEGNERRKGRTKRLLALVATIIIITGGVIEGLQFIGNYIDNAVYDAGWLQLSANYKWTIKEVKERKIIEIKKPEINQKKPVIFYMEGKKDIGSIRLDIDIENAKSGYINMRSRDFLDLTQNKTVIDNNERLTINNINLCNELSTAKTEINKVEKGKYLMIFNDYTQYNENTIPNININGKLKKMQPLKILTEKEFLLEIIKWCALISFAVTAIILIIFGNRQTISSGYRRLLDQGT